MAFIPAMTAGWVGIAAVCWRKLRNDRWGALLPWCIDGRGS
jgi:hypothetical protein